MTEGMKNLQKKFVFERQAPILQTENLVKLAVLQAVRWCFDRQPRARLPERDMQIDLTLSLQAVQIVFVTGNVA